LVYAPIVKIIAFERRRIFSDSQLLAGSDSLFPYMQGLAYGPLRATFLSTIKPLLNMVNNIVLQAKKLCNLFDVITCCNIYFSNNMVTGAALQGRQGPVPPPSFRLGSQWPPVLCVTLNINSTLPAPGQDPNTVYWPPLLPQYENASAATGAG
jgi:hypothetical protein